MPFPDAPKTPPAWFAQYQRRQEEQQRELTDLRSKVGANNLASQHQVGQLAELVTEFRDEMRTTLAALKEAVADLQVLR